MDSSRVDPFHATPSARREIVVYVWYPAEAQRGRRPAAYIPHFAEIAASLGDSLTFEEFGLARAALVSGVLRSHSFEDAPLSRAGRPFPVLVFSHGFQESSLTYSAQLEDLASHGYVVFGIEHPFDAYAVWMGAGRVERFPQALWDSALARPKGAVAYQLAQVPLRSDDIRFLVDQLGHLGRFPRAHRFAKAIDLHRIGAFGHSLGGLAAANACRRDARILACANEDADDQGRPYDGGPAALVIKQPFLFFATGHSTYVSPRTPPPTDVELVNMRLTREQYDSIVSLYQHNQDASLASMPGGAIRIQFEAEDFTHRSFIDLRVLQGLDNSIVTLQRHHLALIRAYTLAFFDHELRNEAMPLLTAEGTIDSVVTVTHFADTARQAGGE